MTVTIALDKAVNIVNLIQELAAAGFTRTSSRPEEFIQVEDSDDKAAVIAIYEAHVAGPSLSEVQNMMADAVQAHMDAVVAERGYGSILAATSYASSSIAQWAEEAEAAIAWRDAVWVACYDVIAAVRAGTRSIPSKDELVAELPVMKWPA
jgi:hypothetical protein